MSHSINVTTLLDRYPPVWLYRKIKTSQAENVQIREKYRLSDKTFQIQKFSDSKHPL